MKTKLMEATAAAETGQARHVSIGKELSITPSMVCKGQCKDTTPCPIPSCGEVVQIIFWEFPCPAWAVASCSSGP